MEVEIFKKHIDTHIDPHILANRNLELWNNNAKQNLHLTPAADFSPIRFRLFGS